MIAAKKKPCGKCGEEKLIWKNHEGVKYCRPCWFGKDASAKPKEKKASPIKPRSEKKARQDVLYSKMRQIWLNTPGHNCCEAKLPGCKGCRPEYLQVHHKKGRGIYYLDTRTWATLCDPCHRYVETHPADAKALGLSLNRLNEDL